MIGELWGGSSRLAGARGRWRRSLIAPLAFVALACSLIPWSTSATAANETLSRVARIPLNLSGSGHAGFFVAIDASARRAITTDPSANNTAGVLMSFDLDTMKPAVTMPFHATSATATALRIYTAYDFAVDEAGHRLFLVLQDQTTDGFLVGVFDTRSLALLESDPVPNGFTTGGGFYYSPQDQILYMAWSSLSNVSLGAMDMKAGSSNEGKTLWTESTGACVYLVDRYIQVALGEYSGGGNHYLYSLCQLQSAYANGAGGIQGGGAVVRFPTPSDPRTAQPGTLFNGATEVFPGVVTGQSGTESVWDPKDRRLVALVPQGSGYASYVFDAATTKFVGAPSLLQAAGSGVFYQPLMAGLGMDPSTGRMYSEDSEGSLSNKNGQACYNFAGGNVFSVLESGLLGNAAFPVATEDQYVNGDDHLMGFDTTKRNLWMVNNELAPQPCNASNQAGPSYLDVYHDSIPPAQQAAVPDPDLSTTGLPEVAGQTGANYGAHASAFGVRYQAAPSGTEGPLTNVGVGGFPNLDCSNVLLSDALNYPLGVLGAFGMSANAVPLPPIPPQYHNFCNAGNRLATFAHVAQVSLDASETRSTSVAADTNNATAQDLSSGTNISQPGPYLNTVSGYVNDQTGSSNQQPPCTETLDAQGNNQDSCATPQQLQAYDSGMALPYSPASCQDPGTANSATTQGQVTATAPSFPPLAANVPGKADAFCSYGTPEATGDASVNGSDIGIPIWVHKASSDAEVIRSTSGVLPDGTKAIPNAVAAVSHSLVAGIDIDGLVQIGRLETWADVWAHGRKGENSAAYSCKVTGLMVGSVSLPDTEDCWNTKVQSLIDVANQALTGHLRLDFVQPYGDPKAGAYSDPSKAPMGRYGLAVEASKGGYLANVGLSTLDQFQNQIMLSDRDIALPGLTATVFMDTPQERDRLAVSFAAVAASATYGIFPLGDFSDLSGDLGGGLTQPLPEAGIVAPPPSAIPTPTGGTPTTPTGTAVSTGSPLQRFVEGVIDGVRVLWQHPGAIPPLIAMWLLLATPAYLAIRQRTLTAKIALRRS